MIPDMLGLIKISSLGLIFPVAIVVLEIERISGSSVSYFTGGCAFFCQNQTSTAIKDNARKTKTVIVHPFFIFLFCLIFESLYFLFYVFYFIRFSKRLLVLL